MHKGVVRVTRVLESRYRSDDNQGSGKQCDQTNKCDEVNQEEVGETVAPPCAMPPSQGARVRPVKLQL
eukprot:3466322-Prymnesium_polylepis.2